MPWFTVRRILLCGLILGIAKTGAAQSLSSLQAEVKRLAAAQRKTDSTITRLLSRISKLEDDAEQEEPDVSDEAEKEESAKELAAIEKRIAALERAGSGKGGSAGNNGASRLRAPFVIEDTDGSVIFRVTGGKSPRLMIGEEQGGSVELGTGSAGGGIVRVRDASNSDGVMLIASEGWGQLRALSRTSSAVITSQGEFGATLGLFKGDTPTVRLQSGLVGYGSFILSDPSGNPLVFGGAIALGGGHVGVVKTGPKARPGSLGPPSVLQGAH